MADKLTAKQERFCLEYIKNGGNASDAYKSAGYSTNMKPKSVWEIASRLLAKIKVRSRVDAMQAELSKSNMITLESHTKEVREIMQEAREEGAYGPAMTGATLVARMHGLFEPKEQSGPVQPDYSGFVMRTAEAGFSNGAVKIPGSGSGAEMRMLPEAGDTAH